MIQALRYILMAECTHITLQVCLSLFLSVYLSYPHSCLLTCVCPWTYIPDLLKFPKSALSDFVYHLRLFTQWRRKVKDSLWVKWVFHLFLAQKKKNPKNNLHMPKHRVYTLWGSLLGYQALGWQNPMHRLACHAINVGTAWLLLKFTLNSARIF